MRSAMWHTQQPSLAVTVEESGIHAWDISDQGVKVRVEWERRGGKGDQGVKVHVEGGGEEGRGTEGQSVWKGRGGEGRGTRGSRCAWKARGVRGGEAAMEHPGLSDGRARCAMRAGRWA